MAIVSLTKKHKDIIKSALMAGEHESLITKEEAESVWNALNTKASLCPNTCQHCKQGKSCRDLQKR